MLAPSPEFDEILSCGEARRAAFGMARIPAAPLSCFPHGRQHSLPYAFTLFYDALRAQALVGPPALPARCAGATPRAGVPPRRTGRPVQEVQTCDWPPTTPARPLAQIGSLRLDPCYSARV